jgi:peptidoglycan/LPS O-acetylase OafA/YrhL
LFFVISGFLITGILLDTRGETGFYKNFYARRGLRIFPLYYGFLLAAFTVIPLVQGGPYFETEFLQESGSPWWYILYGGNIREAFLGHEPAYILAPLWSLSIEEQFYLTFPLIVALCSRKQLATLLVGCLAFAPLFRAAMLGIFPDNERIQYLATLSRVDVIAWGGLLAIGLRSGKVPSPRVIGALFVTAFAAAATAFTLGGLDRHSAFCRVAGYSLVGVTFALVVLWSLQHRETAATAWLRSKALCGLGTLCYGVYLLQRPAEIILLKVLGRAGVTLGEESFILMVLKCAFALFVAWLSWRCFEKPILKLKRFFTSRHHPSQAEPTPLATRVLDTPREEVPARVTAV